MKLLSFYLAAAAVGQKSKGDINLNLDPEILMTRLVKRYGQFIGENFDSSVKSEANFVDRINAKIQKQLGKVIDRYQSANEKCGHWPKNAVPQDVDEESDGTR